MYLSRLDGTEALRALPLSCIPFSLSVPRSFFFSQTAPHRKISPCGSSPLANGLPGPSLSVHALSNTEGMNREEQSEAGLFLRRDEAKLLHEAKGIVVAAIVDNLPISDAIHITKPQFD